MQGPNGALDIDLGGLTPGSQFDRLAITGTAQLHSLFNVTRLGGYLPTPGDTFRILTASQVRGALRRLMLSVYLSAWTPLAPSACFSATGKGSSLVRKGGTWFLTNKRVLAQVFDFHADNVIELLKRVQRELGVELAAVQLRQGSIAETCDACGRHLSIREVLFDGSRFLCRACRTNALLGLTAPLPRLPFQTLP